MEQKRQIDEKENDGMNLTRRNFLCGLTAAGAMGFAGCVTAADGKGKGGAKILFGACRGPDDAALLKSVGYDFWEWDVGEAFDPTKDAEWWKRQRDFIRSRPLPLRSCTGFIPWRFRLTGPKADHEPALRYAETVLRRAEEIDVKTIVFGSGGARNVPGDCLAETAAGRPDAEKGRDQYRDFCAELCRRVADLKTVAVVVEPLRPNESNVVNFVWQGLQICEEVGSPRLALLADVFHMMMGREPADSLRLAGAHLKHCHVASYATRNFPGSEPETVDRLRPYFAALKAIGYAGGISCECGWGAKADFAKNLETALTTMKGLI